MADDVSPPLSDAGLAANRAARHAAVLTAAHLPGSCPIA